MVFSGPAHLCRPHLLRHCMIQGRCPNSFHGLCTNTFTSRVSILEFSNLLSVPLNASRSRPEVHFAMYLVALQFCGPAHQLCAQCKGETGPLTASRSCSLTRRAEKRWLGTLRLAAYTMSNPARATQRTNLVSPYRSGYMPQ